MLKDTQESETYVYNYTCMSVSIFIWVSARIKVHLIYSRF